MSDPRVGKAPPSSEITPEHVYVNRRQFLERAAAATAGLALVAGPGSPLTADAAAQQALANVKKSPLSVHKKKDAAVKKGRSMAKRAGGVLKIKARNGKVQAKRRYAA